MLQACGYATDPDYGRKLRSLIAAHDLKKYDREVEKVYKELLEKVNKQQNQIDALLKKVERLEAENKQIPAPPWFVQEFGDATAGGLVQDVDGLKHPAAWEAIAIALRAQGIGKKGRG